MTLKSGFLRSGNQELVLDVILLSLTLTLNRFYLLIYCSIGDFEQVNAGLTALLQLDPHQIFGDITNFSEPFLKTSTVAESWHVIFFLILFHICFIFFLFYFLSICFVHFIYFLSFSSFIIFIFYFFSQIFLIICFFISFHFLERNQMKTTWPKAGITRKTNYNNRAVTNIFAGTVF